MEAGRDFGRKIGMVKQFDIIVVGSGFGGAVVACRLAEAGHSVLILERGREWKPEEYPRVPSDAWIWNDSKPEKQNGWIDLRYFRDMTVVQGAAVGGGSLIYANVSVEAEPCIFNNGWPSGITYDLLKPHFKTVGRMLDVHFLPDNQLTKRFNLMREGANKLNHGNRFRKLPLAVTFDRDYSYKRVDPHNEIHSVQWKNKQGQTQGTCIHCGNCDIGCRVQAKNTLDLNYLAAARCAGAEIRPNHIVRRLETSEYGYRVCYQRIEGGKLIPGDVEAKKVVLAAGSLGSTELLLRCRDEFRTLPRISPRLGYGWSSNGDFLTPAIYTHRKISPTRGPTITSAINFLDGSHGGKAFFIEDGGFPDVLGNTIEEFANRISPVGGLLGKVFSNLAKGARGRYPLDWVMPWFGQAIDASNGRLYIGSDWWNPFGRRKLKLRWDVGDSEAVIQAMIDMHKKLSTATGGCPVVPLPWKWFRDLITPHPLGGCGMGTDQSDGVVDSNGKVFCHDGLYVADGAILPKAIGLNPSRTIAALAEHIAKNIIDEQRRYKE